MSYFRILTRCLLLVYFVSAAGCHCFDLLNYETHDDTNDFPNSMISDHFPQFIVLKKSIVDYNTCSFAKHDFSNYNENNLVQDYLSLDYVYAQHNNDTNVDNMFDLFHENLSNTVNKHVPTRKLTRKDIKLHIKPWINQKIKLINTETG